MGKRALLGPLGLFLVVCVACGSPAASPVVARSLPPAEDAAARPTPAAPDAPARGASQIDCGDFHTCARMVDGTVRCWGRNDHGQLGDGTTTDRPSPVSPSGVAGAVEVA